MSLTFLGGRRLFASLVTLLRSQKKLKARREPRVPPGYKERRENESKRAKNKRKESKGRKGRANIDCSSCRWHEGQSRS